MDGIQLNGHHAQQDASVCCSVVKGTSKVCAVRVLPKLPEHIEIVLVAVVVIVPQRRVGTSLCCIGASPGMISRNLPYSKPDVET